MSAPQIIGFDPDPNHAQWDAEDGTATGTYHYDDGSSQHGQLPASYLASLGNPKTAQTMTPKPAELASVAPPAAQTPKPAETPYDVWEQQQIDREKAGKGAALSVDIPKSSRIAYVHNNPGNLKYVGQEGAHQGEPAEDGGHFAAFESPEAGYQALHHQIQTDADRGLSLGQFITKYAPPKSNDTAGYIASASKALGGSPETPIAGMNQERLARFMAQHESSTTIGGVASEASPTGAPAAPAAPQYPAMGAQPPSVDGLPMEEAELHGTPLTRQQLEQRQGAVMDQTNMRVAAEQQATQARMQGRNEALTAVAANYHDQQTNQQRQLAEQQQIKAEAAQNIQETTATQLDPGRLFRGMSGGSVMLGLLASALGGLGQTLQQRAGPRGAPAPPNLAIQRMNKSIDDDVEDQKQNKQSRLAHWTRVYGNAEQGIAATKAEIYNASAQYLQAKVQNTVQNADIQAAGMQQAQDLMALGQQEAQKLQAVEEQKLQIKYQAPKPVHGDAIDPIKKALETDKLAEEQGFKQGSPERAALRRMAGLGEPSAPTAAETKAANEKAKATSDEAPAEGAMNQIQDLGQKAGLARDAGGKWVPSKEGAVPPAFKEQWASMLPGVSTPIANAHDSATMAFAHVLRGARVDPKELGPYKELLGGSTWTRAQLADRLNDAEILIRAKMRPSKRDEEQGAPASWE